MPDSSEKFRVTMMLPFCAKQLMQEPDHRNEAIGNACREYYQGFLLALDSIKSSEVPIELKVLDTQRDSIHFKKLLERKDVQNSDLIIGPGLKDGSEMMVDFCNKFKMYHISPLFTLTKSRIDNPYLISAYPDLNYYGDFILDYIKTRNPEKANIILMTGKEPGEKILESHILSLRSKYPQFSIRSTELGKFLSVGNLYQTGSPNQIIIISENEFLVGSALRHLSDTTLFENLEVFGNRKWLEFKSPNIPQFEQLRVKIVSPFYFDYHLPDARKVNELYRNRYFTEPSEYAISGYEQALFFIGHLTKHHGNMDSLILQPAVKPLSNWYQIRKKPDARSLQNSRMNLLYFEDAILKRQD